MKSVIFCEGVSDALLLSHYLETKNWQFRRDATKKGDSVFIPLPVDNPKEEVANWYACEERPLAIWGVGGQSNLAPSLAKVLTHNLRELAANSFHSFVLLADRDEAASDQDRLQGFTQVFSERGIPVELRNREWVTATYTNRFDEEVTIRILCLIIPFDREGALETFLLTALGDQDEVDSDVIKQCQGFVQNLNSARYLQRTRDRIKAELATTFAIMYPDTMHRTMIDRIRSINWAEYTTIQQSFELLHEL